jgi:hypothetical protein
MEKVPDWDQRPFEIAYLLNPAFCALLLHEAIKGYQKEHLSDSGMPYYLSFLILPIVLHKTTRELLPRRITKELYDWLKENPRVYNDYPGRVRRLTPFTREAIIFGMQRGLIGVDEEGDLVDPNSHSSPLTATCSSRELSLYLKSARLVGRWFARTGNVVTIYRMWRIQP